MKQEDVVHILLVDDREENLFALEAVLKSSQYHLVRATSGIQALELLPKFDFALILLDVQMPGMDGFQTAERVRSDERWETLPIIFLTAINRDETHIHRGYDMGAVDYLFKPFDMTILRSKVAIFADLYRKNRKIQAQERQLQVLYERSETRFRAFFDQSSLPMVVYALDGQLVEVNHAWEKLFSLSKDKMRGYNLFEDTQLEAQGVLKHARKAALGEAAEAPPFLYDPASLNASTHSRWVRTFFFPVKDEKDQVRELALVLSDVTETVETRTNLERAVRARDEFLSIASHELRTPITSMALSTQMLKRQMDRDAMTTFTPERLRKMVDQSERQLDRLTRLIEDMLDIARINTGRFTLQKEPVELAAMITETLDRVRFQLEGAKCEVIREFKPGIIAHCDRYRLEQALTNLLTNVIRYAPAKPIRIRLTVQNEQVDISVVDQGPGISKDDQTRIFNCFERAISSNEVSGLGLGLYIVTQIMHAHGGRVSVASQLGQGSTFTLEFPLGMS